MHATGSRNSNSDLNLRSAVKTPTNPLPAWSPGGNFPVIWLWLAFVFVPGMGLGETFNLTEVAKGIYVHQGRQVGLDSPLREDIANIGFIVGEKCVAVVDTGGSIKMGQRLGRAIRKIAAKPVCYVINTHVHYDHVLGNHAFSRNNISFVGHRSLFAAIENNREFFIQSFADELGGSVGKDRVKGPDISVAETRELDLGNRIIRLRAHRVSHTSSDLSVLDVKTNTLWIADLLFVQRVPVLDGSLKGWLKEIEKLEALNVSKMIPGHGKIPEDWRVALAAQKRYLKILEQEIRSIIKKGGFLEDALQTVGKSERSHWLLFDENHKRNVSRAYAELEWE